MFSILLLLGVLFSVPRSVFPYGNLGNTTIRGVNLGGWLILEKWMTPKVFEGLPESVDDEYKLCKHLGKTEAKKRLESHWKTWVTEQDIIDYKNAGLNHVRLPIGYWAYDIKPDEPWVNGSLDYAKKAIGWCKKHGLKVMLDLHGLPGSQNGNDHSGQSGEINFFNDDNLKRATNIVRQMAEWANTTEWRDTVTIIQVANEPILWGKEYHSRLKKLKEYYKMAYDAVREKNDVAVVAVHDAFIDYKNWYYLREDKHYWWVMLDTHIYQVFGDQYKNMTCEEHEKAVCKKKAKLQEANSKLWTVVGEWSLSTPIKCDSIKTAMGRNQIGVYEQTTGWFFWAHKNGQGWKDWSFEDSYKNGWISLTTANIDSC